MGKLIFAMVQSLDGYVAAVDGALEPPLHPTRWDEDRLEWSALEQEFAKAWRAHPNGS